ncbi:Ig-like domain (group 3) [Amycolatopsis arida]|uniref:Ig-like domain (Group 3) n=1 Tax=Amycolatopsis arida TaxID=587909 RepID=A0A1I5M1I5_9PSEU|nr:chitobiase/beta-hexosaminidase C-terminal domain-containing protein [Amycolatopsis arida]TDX93927.1 Ig-like protein group 3 [Amycolatopsis arida]SFP03313.1 Ig-like domain (group 3) [Amycolatopsis arida]
MFSRLLARRSGAARGTAVAVLVAALAALWLPTSAASQSGAARSGAPTAAAEQVLRWTANDSLTEYPIAPTTATAGPATIVFENSLATGNTTGMAHTLTFDTSSPGYNHDVDLNIVASPFDAKNGLHEAQVTLTPGTYRYYCAMPGHGEMAGVLEVTDDGGGDDTTPPSVAAAVSGDQDADGNYVGSATVTVSAEDAGSGVASVEYAMDGAAFQPYTGPVTVDQVGEHTVRFRATDRAGNVSEVGSVSFGVVEPAPADTTPPVVTASVSGDQDAEGNYVGSATVTVSAEDAGSGVASVEYEVDDTGFQPYSGPVTVDRPGDHSVQYRATDNAGNLSETGSVLFSVVEPTPDDTTPPVVTASVSGDQDAEGNYVGSATVAISARDAGSGVASVEYAVHAGHFVPYTGPVTVDQVGEHTVWFRAADNAGNVSEVGSVLFTVVEPAPGDTTPPEVSATVAGDQDADGNYVGAATVTISARDTVSGVDTLTHALDGGSFQPYTAPVVVSAPGEHTVRYRATDHAGNASEVGSVSFTVVEPAPDDTTPPTVSASVAGDQDAEGHYVGSATVTVSAVDAGSGVASVEYELDGAGFGDYGGPVVVTSPGEHTVRFRATDRGGNASEIGSVTFTVVAADSDACPGSDVRPTVVIGNHDSTVANVDTGNGCTINDLIDEHGEYANHGQFVKHVRQVTADLVARGVISEQERARIVRAAARSDVGKNGE